MIVIDSSAIVAILWREPSADALAARIKAEPPGERRMSVASYLEVGSVLAGRSNGDRLGAIADLDALLASASITLVPVDEAQARLALRARILHGRGMGHGGVLNFGDCFSYALAKHLNAPLLFIGDDFGATDVERALPDPGFCEAPQPIYVSVEPDVRILVDGETVAFEDLESKVQAATASRQTDD